MVNSHNPYFFHIGLHIHQASRSNAALIAAVAFHLGKVTGRDELLEDLHQILYGRKGKVCMLYSTFLSCQAMFCTPAHCC